MVRILLFAFCSKRNPARSGRIPAEIFINLDKPGAPPRHQAQIFIDVNFYQKKVDRSLVADLFPTARGKREPLDDKERAQDLGRKLMLETGPLVGMIQIPGIRFGVADVVTLATLNSAIEEILPYLTEAGIESLEGQAHFLAQCLDAWLDATGRREDLAQSGGLDPENVAYQSRAIVSFLTLIPACIWELRRKRLRLLSPNAREFLEQWLRDTMKRARLLKNGRFLPKGDFRHKGYLGSGGLARFRDTLWVAAMASKPVPRATTEKLAELAGSIRAEIKSKLGRSHED